MAVVDLSPLLSPLTEGLRVQLVMTWGDHHYAGLTGLEIVGKDGDSLPLDLSMMDASPRDINDLPENCRDLRTLDKYDWHHTPWNLQYNTVMWLRLPNTSSNVLKSNLSNQVHFGTSTLYPNFFPLCLVSVSLLRLIDGINITTSDEHMWLIPFSYGESHTLSVTFSEAQSIAGLRIWNYNKSPEDSYRGVKHFTSKLPSSQPSFSLRFVCTTRGGENRFSSYNCIMRVLFFRSFLIEGNRLAGTIRTFVEPTTLGGSVLVLTAFSLLLRL